jgi:hypothetical protein
MTNRVKVATACGLLAATALVLPQPRADFRILMHQASDPSPRTAVVAFDAGLLAGRLLVTWTADRLAR